MSYDEISTALYVPGPISDPHSFWLEARYQTLCAVCEKGGDFHAHHVVPRGLLRRLRKPEWDTRNALRLCPHCHMAFEWAGVGKIAVPVTAWKDQNVCYCWDTLGVTAVQLEGKYGPMDADPRWARHLTGDCPLCQAQRP